MSALLVIGHLTGVSNRIRRHSIMALILAAALIGATQSAHAQGRPAGVVVETVEERPFVETAPVLGELVAPTDSVVAARVSGLINIVSVQVGDQVAEGAILAQLDTELLEIELAAAQASKREAEAGFRVAEADLTLAKQNFERMERLQDSPAFSEGQFNDLAAQVQRAQGQIAQAQARIRSADVAISRAEYNLNNAQVKAPFSGTLLEVPAQTGSYINIGNPVARLLDQQTLEVVADVPAAYVSGLTQGREIGVRTGSGNEYVAMVRAVLPQETVSTRSRPVRFNAPFTRVQSADGSPPFAAGQSVTLAIPVAEERTVLTVPKDALVQGRGGWIVYIDDNGKASPRPVQVGAAVGGRFEVLGGLQGGESVVVRGNERLRPGQDIQAMPAGGRPEGGPPAAGGGKPSSESAG